MSHRQRQSIWTTKELHTAALVIFVVIVQLIGNVRSYETYYMDHEVTERQARDSIAHAYNHTQKRTYFVRSYRRYSILQSPVVISLLLLTKSVLIFSSTDGTPNWCSECTEEVRTYCLSQSLIKDHCCCDQGHKKGTRAHYRNWVAA